MQQMASRPFATINVAVETEEEPPDLIGGNVKVSRTPGGPTCVQLTGALVRHGGWGGSLMLWRRLLPPPVSQRLHQPAGVQRVGRFVAVGGASYLLNAGLSPVGVLTPPDFCLTHLALLYLPLNR